MTNSLEEEKTINNSIKKIRNIFILILFVLSFFLTPLTLYAKKLPPGTGEGDVPTNILLMLDLSGSMTVNVDSTSAELIFPIDVDTDSDGNIYVLEHQDCQIKKFTSDGAFVKAMGNCGYGNLELKNPYAFAVNSSLGYIAVANTYAHSVKIFDLDLNFVIELNVESFPTGIAWDSSNYIYVATYLDSKVHKYSTNGSRHLSAGKGYGTGSGYMQGTMEVDVDSNGNIYVVDYHNHRVNKFNSSGNLSTSWGSRGSGNGSFYYPHGLVIDSNDNVFVGERSGDRVQKFNSSGTYDTQFGGEGTGKGDMNYVLGLGIDSSDRIYVSDAWNWRIGRFTNTGTWVDNIGRGRRRIDVARKVIKQFLSDPNVVGGAHYGLMTWSSGDYRTKLDVEINEKGVSNILRLIDSIEPYWNGGTDLGRAMDKARDYFRGSYKSYESPRNDKAKECEENYIIVISDGDWQYGKNPDPIAKDLVSSYKIGTFAIGYEGYSGASTKARYVSLAKAGQIPNDKSMDGDPLYADNSAQFLQQLKIIAGAISGTKDLTYTAPQFITEKNQDGNEIGDFVYQSTFAYKENKQWEGKLMKYELDEITGGIKTEVWEAGKKLENKSPDNRNIWTIGYGLTSTDGTPDSYNNFTTANVDYLYKPMFEGTKQTSADAETFISFIRGYDKYDTDKNNATTTRYKLADIFHSEITIVSPPNIAANEILEEISNTEAAYRKANGYEGFKSKSLSGGKTVGNRKEIVLVGSNAGMLHAFDTTDGEELWAFIPPNMIPQLKDMRSDVANTSNSISGVDGSPVVKAIYYDHDDDGTKEWRTIAIVGMGPGGSGYFALDITNTEKPSHLFTFKNNPVDKIVTFWNANGDPYEFSYKQGLSITDYDYSNLGYAYSNPYILRMGINGNDKWVAVFGGGYNIGETNYASSVFVVDLEDGGAVNNNRGGKLIQDINLVNKTQKERESSLNKDKPTQMSSYVADGVTNQYEVTFPYNDKSQIEVYVDNAKTSFSWVNKYRVKTDSVPLRNALVQIKRNPKILEEEINNSVPARLSMLLTDNIAGQFDTANYKGAIFYAVDIEGKVWKIDMTGNTASFKKNILFDAEGDTYNQRYSFHQITAAMFNDQDIGLYFGTGNMDEIALVDENRFDKLPKDKKLSDGQKEKLKIRNRIYGIKDKKFPEFIEINDTNEKNSLTNSAYEKGSLTINECSDGSSCPPKDSQLGWYTNLKNDGGKIEIKNDKVTGKALVLNDTLYVSRYAASYDKPCEPGIGRLASYNPKCGDGKSGFAGITSSVIELGKGILTTPVAFKDKIYVGVSGEAENEDENKEGDPCLRDANLIICNPATTTGDKYIIKIDSWRELF